MAFNYDDTVLATSTKDYVRFLISDTVENSGPKPKEANFSDAEVEFVIDENSDDPHLAASSLFSILAGMWSKYTDSKTGDASDSWSKIAEAFREDAKDMEKRSALKKGAASVDFYLSRPSEDDELRTGITQEDADDGEF